MADVHDKKTRSYNMSQIKGKNTKPEMLVRKFLHANGFRYRLHVKNLPGKPDIVLPKYKTVIFVHGCFFHQHNCHDFKWPATNQEFWKNKISGNVLRDRSAIKALKKIGWEVINVWGCELKNKKISQTLANLPGKIVP
jgi:DNA mismatch endonuclease (patch repair protein)